MSARLEDALRRVARANNISGMRMDSEDALMEGAKYVRHQLNGNNPVVLTRKRAAGALVYWGGAKTTEQADEIIEDIDRQVQIDYEGGRHIYFEREGKKIAIGYSK